MAFNVVGLIAIIFFYVLILMVGLWAARKTKSGADSEEVMLAGRNIGVIVGIFTMTATWVGGGYINGTTEMLYSSGLMWCQAPFGYALSLIMGGILFAEKMRTEGYVTMLDPFQNKYGKRMGGLMFIPALLGETFWSAAILAALGATLTVILDIDNNVSVIVSACIAVFYTFFGGLYSVAYTDVVQLFCIFVGLWICIPAAMLNPITEDIGNTTSLWVGSVGGVKEWFNWLDCGLLLIFGGIPWQVYFQRVLSSSDPKRAKILSYVAAGGCIVMAIPSVIIGAIAKSTDWSRTDWKPNNTVVKEIPSDYHKLTLPLVLQYLTPPYIAFVGLGAVSAAVMSSADSSILSAASMFARNVYKLTIRPAASEIEVIRVMKVSIVGVGVLATIMALTIKSIYGLWYLCADLVYVILFPQLLCVVYMQKSNTYGSFSGYVVGMFFRVLGGEHFLNLPAVIWYPWYDPADNIQYFPFRTLSMILSLSAVVGVSLLAEYLFMEKIIPARFDIFMCLVGPPESSVLRDPSFSASTDALNWNNAKLYENGGLDHLAPPGGPRRDPSLATIATTLEESTPIRPTAETNFSNYHSTDTEK